MKKVTILALHLGYGGIERCVCNLANSICKDYDVEIISTYKLYDESIFKVDDKVKIKYLIDEVKPNREELKTALKTKKFIWFIKESFKSIYCLFLRRSRTVHAIKSCDSDVIISTRILFNNYLGKYGNKKAKKIGWEHNHHHGNINYIKKMVNSCRNLDMIVFVSESLKSFYKKELKAKKYKCRAVYIPNSLDSIPDVTSKLNNKDIVSIGRFSREKGFPDLIDVFNLAYQKDNSLRLHLVGDGTQRNMIVDKIYQYGLQDKIIVYGYLDKDKINEILKKSSLYVMTSFTESFGIVLLEAMSYGIPCIAFKSAEGACDLIKENYNGYLIDNRDKEVMASKIVEVLGNKKILKELGSNAKVKCLEYSNDIVSHEWLNILK